MHGRETVGKMEKFSVKKPFTVLVAVVMVLILGFVAITKMQTNLLPDVSTPYLMVVTVYPGASPERVESEVSDVLQNALTVPGVENITATSAENYSLLLMHFTDDTDMNSALVKVSNKLDQAKSDLPSSCLTPSIIEYSLNMNAFMTVAVSREGSDIYQMSELVKDTLVPYVQRKGGVSNVSSSGLVEKLVQVQLNQDKIDEINAQLLDLIDTKLADARAQLDSAESQIAAGRAEYNKQMKNFGNTVSNTVLASMSTEVGNAVDVVRKQARALMESVNQLIAVVKEPEIQQALIEVQQGLQKVLDKFDNTGMRDIDSLIEVVSELRDVTDKLTDALQKLQERVNTETGTEGSSAADLADELQLQKSLQVIYSTLEDTIKAMDNVPQLMSTFSRALGSFTQQQLNAYMQFTEAREQLNEYEKQLETAKQEYETARTQALAQADVQKQLDINTLSTLIYAQNFSMPAGYVQDASGESWLLKVGEEYNSVDDIAGALLLHVDGYGDVRLSDVADVEVIDNAADSFTRLNGEQAAVLKIYKNATSSASDVSDNCLSAFQELEAQYDGLHRPAVGQQDVFGDAHHGLVVVVLKGCVNSCHQPQATEHLGLVEGEPVPHPARQGFGYDLRILGKPVGAGRVLPAPLPVKGGGQVPVVEGHQWLDAVFQQLVAEILVKSDARLVDLANTLGQHPGPADGKPVGLQAHLLHQGHILSPAVVKINGDVGVLAVGDLAGAVMDQGVPDGLPFAVGVPAALDLGGRCGCAPQEIFGEGGHNLSSLYFKNPPPGVRRRIAKKKYLPRQTGTEGR